MAVDATRRPRQTGLEGRVDLAHGLPVRFEVLDRGQADAGVALGVLERGDEGGEARLARRPRHGRRGRVDGVGSGIRGGEEGRELTAGGVVGVDVDGQVEVLPQGGHELRDRGGAEQSGHVLDGEHMSTGADDLLGQPEVVVEGVELLPRIEDVRGVAQGHLGDRRVGGPDGFDGRTHLLDVIEGVEDAEDVDAGPRRLVDEGIGDLRRVRGVADRVASAQEHLQGDVRDRLPRWARRSQGSSPRKRGATS